MILVIIFLIITLVLLSVLLKSWGEEYKSLSEIGVNNIKMMNGNNGNKSDQVGEDVNEDVNEDAKQVGEDAESVLKKIKKKLGSLWKRNDDPNNPSASKSDSIFGSGGSSGLSTTSDFSSQSQIGGGYYTQKLISR